MKLFTPEINWHNRDPIYSVDYAIIAGKYERLASCGTGSCIRIWQISEDLDDPKITFRSSLERHSASVNVVRFSPDNTILASAGDDGMVIIWRLIEESIKECPENNLDDSNIETWNVERVIRAHREDVYDLAWSPDSKTIITASIDNTASIIDLQKTVCVNVLKESKHYLQGVCWDPLNEYVVTMSSDSTCRIYNISKKKLCYANRKTETIIDGNCVSRKLYRDENLSSFFRRCAFSPDGLLLVTPAGISLWDDQGTESATFVYHRDSLSRPLCELPTAGKDSIIVRFCPSFFKLPEMSDRKLLDVNYCMLFAIATLDSVLIYSTHHVKPIGIISSIHYTVLSDITWSSDGKFLIISSADGFCSIVVTTCIPRIALFIEISQKVKLQVAPEAIIEIKPTKRRVEIKNTMESSPSSVFTPEQQVDHPLETSDNKSGKKTPRRVPFITLQRPS